jgi:hypothetical protein
MDDIVNAIYQLLISQLKLSKTNNIGWDADNLKIKYDGLYFAECQELYKIITISKRNVTLTLSQNQKSYPIIFSCQIPRQNNNIKEIEGMEINIDIFDINAEELINNFQENLNDYFNHQAFFIASYNFQEDIINFSIPGISFKNDQGQDDFLLIKINSAESALRHELTHYVQFRKKPRFIDDKYLNSRASMYEVTENIITINYFLYYFNNIEISPRANQLTFEMKQLNANKENYKQVFNQTFTGNMFNIVTNKINEIFNNNNITENEWNEIKTYFEKTKQIPKTNNPTEFKHKIFNELQNKINYTRKKYSKAIIHAIGEYNNPNQKWNY